MVEIKLGSVVAAVVSTVLIGRVHNHIFFGGATSKKRGHDNEVVR